MECDVIALNSFFENAGRDAIFQFVINEKLFSLEAERSNKSLAPRLTLLHVA